MIIHRDIKPSNVPVTMYDDNGIKDIESPDLLSADRQWKPGAGRRSREEEQPDLVKALEALIEPQSRGDPMSSLRWTCKSTRSLAHELKARVFRWAVRKWLSC